MTDREKKLEEAIKSAADNLRSFNPICPELLGALLTLDNAIKPEPLRLWLNVYRDDFSTYETEEDARRYLLDNGETVEMIQVEKE